MAQGTVGIWGDNLAVRLPGDVVRADGLRDGERVEIKASPILEELFVGRNPLEWRADYADSHDWGPDVGHEVVAG